MTAQHAQRQGKRAAQQHRRLATGTVGAAPYKHHDLGFVVDLGGTDAAANPLQAAAVRAARQGGHPRLPPAVDARQPGRGSRADWVLDAALTRPATQLGLVPANAVPLESSSPEVPARTR